MMSRNRSTPAISRSCGPESETPGCAFSSVWFEERIGIAGQRDLGSRGGGFASRTMERWQESDSERDTAFRLFCSAGGRDRGVQVLLPISSPQFVTRTKPTVRIPADPPLPKAALRPRLIAAPKSRRSRTPWRKMLCLLPDIQPSMTLRRMNVELNAVKCWVFGVGSWVFLAESPRE